MKIVIEASSLEELRLVFQEFAGKQSGPTDPLSSLPIDSLGLELRTSNCLKAEKIFTIGQLSEWTTTALLKTPNLGVKSLTELMFKLHDLRVRAIAGRQE